jgi:hypothetical protein
MSGDPEVGRFLQVRGRSAAVRSRSAEAPDGKGFQPYVTNRFLKMTSVIALPHQTKKVSTQCPLGTHEVQRNHVGARSGDLMDDQGVVIVTRRTEGIWPKRQELGSGAG